MAQEDIGQPYVIQTDDTLWKIAEKYLGDGDRFGDIVAATQAKQTQDASFATITDPSLIFAGSQLWIPSAASLTTQNTTNSVPTPITPAHSLATSGQPTGQIAFSFWNDAPNRCTYEINVIDVSACLESNQSCQANRRIFSLNNVSEPALSPNGNQLAFRGWGDLPEKHLENQVNHPYFNCATPRAERHLGHTTLDGTEYTTTGPFWEDAHPDWSPDGQRLLLDTARNGDGLTRIMTISTDGTFEEDLRIAGQQPAWAADSNRFVYRGCDLTGNRCGLWLAQALPVQAWDVGLNIIGPLVEDSQAAHPDWSPTTDQIVYQSATDGAWNLYIIAADGSNKRQLTDSPSLEGLPAWSPDGQWIAYLSNTEGNWGIWAIKADGSQPQLLFPFDNGIFTPQAVTPYFTRDWLDEQISWSR